METEGKKITAIIVDDEKLSRERIKAMLALDKDIVVLDECTNGLEAIDKVDQLQPDILFLDIQMPDLNGFGVVEHLARTYLPFIVFITAYDEYAVKAFEVNAIDYLLKPFDKARFVAALHRVKNAVMQQRREKLSLQITDLLQTLQKEKKYLQRVVIKTLGRIYFIKTETIDWIEAAGNYAVLYCKKEKYLYRETLKSLEEQLDPAQFVRIHRSKIVNIDRIKELQSWSHGDYLIILTDGTKLHLSRNYRDNLKNF
mgnify:CR=1 FL=1